jgi:hypothetical protein
MGRVEKGVEEGDVRCRLHGGVVVLYLGDMNAMDRDLNDEPTWGCLVPMRRRG